MVLFYVVGGHLGVWAPQDLQYSDTLSTALPWIYPLTIGIYAAASEEFLFRLFSVHFLLRITNSRFLAVVLPAFAWGFLHSNYPQEPPYIRGIEVGLDRHRGGSGDAALGNPGDADLALHGGRVSDQPFADALAAICTAAFRAGSWVLRALIPDLHRRGVVSGARGIRGSGAAAQPRGASRGSCAGRRSTPAAPPTTIYNAMAVADAGGAGFVRGSGSWRLCLR